MNIFKAVVLNKFGLSMLGRARQCHNKPHRKGLPASIIIGVFVLAGAAGWANAGNETAKLHIQSTILPSLEYRILHEPSVLRITKRDIRKRKDKRKRHKRVKNGTILSVETNSVNGYILSVQSLASEVFTSVEVKIELGGPSFVLSPGGSMDIHVPYNGKNHNTK